MTYFSPIILHQGMRLNVAASYCLVATSYAFAAIYMFEGAWTGDRYHIRGSIIIVNSIFAIIGLAVMGYAASPGAQHVSVFFVAADVNASITAFMIYQASNIRDQWNRAFASASLIGHGGLKGIVGRIVFSVKSCSMPYPWYLDVHGANFASPICCITLKCLFSYSKSAGRETGRYLGRARGILLYYLT